MLNIILLSITEKCNLDCKHCFAVKNHSEIDFENACRIIDKIKNRTRIVNLTGGEPLLYPKLFELIRYIKKTPLKVTISTNGCFLNREVAHRLKKSGLDGINVSLDSVHPAKHDFFRGKKGALKAAERGIKTAVESGLNCRVATSLGKFNYKEVEELTLRAADLGCSAISFRRILPVEKALSSFKSQILNKKEIIFALKQAYKCLLFLHPYLNVYIQEPIDLYLSQKVFQSKLDDFGGCGAGRTLVEIKTNGDVWPCFAIPLKLGNIFEKSLEEILAHSVARSLIDQTVEGDCQTCGLKRICGGCRAWALFKTGNFLATDPSCLKDNCQEIIGDLPVLEEKTNLKREEIKQIMSLTTKFMKPVFEKSGMVWRSELLENDLKKNKDKFWILKSNSKLIGYLWFVADKPEVYLKSIIIDRQWQKKHFGPLLIKRLELFTRSERKNKIRLTIQKSNDASLGFFTCLGYKKVGKEKNKGLLLQKIVKKETAS